MTDHVEGYHEQGGTLADADADADAGSREPENYAAARLRLLQRRDVSGARRRAGLAELTDRWLAALLAHGLVTAAGRARGNVSASSRVDGWPPGVSLVAVGGYGRGELSPRSDLDLLLLYGGSSRTGEISTLADRLWYPVWDMGLALDHSVRTLAEAKSAAASDLKTQLGLLDARHIGGDASLTASLRTAVFADWRAAAPKRLPELRELCAERAERHGELSFLLEPDLKEARGGLRDTVVLRAVAASWLADAPREGLEAARTRLLDTRDALHLTTGRATDRLTLQEHEQVASALGLLGGDVLLRGVYEAARTIGYACDVTWREVSRVLRSRQGEGRRGSRGWFGVGGSVPRPTRAAERSPLADGVVEHEGEAVLASTARPDRDPVLPLRAAAAAAQVGLPLSPHAVRRLVASVRPLPVPWPVEAREQLVTLLGAGEGTVAVWEALQAGGLITRLLPDWERVRCRPQHNPVHRWTVDRHLVETAVRACALTRRVSRPDLLLVAALLHDIGKGEPGDHSVAGKAIARNMAVSMGFGPGDVDVIALLVRHHLLLVETATRRDLDDPVTVRRVAETVGGTEALELLHALTEADALATGPAAWSAWRASLVADLVKRVGAALAGGTVPEQSDPEPTAEEVWLAAEAVRSGGPVITLRTHPHQDVEHVGEEPEPVGVELLLAVSDRPGLLAAAAGVLALHRLTVRAADLRSLDPRGTGPITLMRWRVAVQYGELPDAARLRHDVARALDGTLDVPGRLAEREAAYPRRRGFSPPPPRVTVAHGTSSTATVLEVRAQDAPGLLHRIGRAMEGTGARIRSARISTLGASVVDAFYVVGQDGAPFSDGHALEVARVLERALA